MADLAVNERMVFLRNAAIVIVVTHLLIYVWSFHAAADQLDLTRFRLQSTLGSY